MGKGDKKSRRGKIRQGSFGVSRPRKKKKSGRVIIKSPAISPAPVKEEKPVVVVETESPVVQIQEPVVEKVKTKKAPAKKPAEKADQEPKPKAAKPKKKTE